MRSPSPASRALENQPQTERTSTCVPKLKTALPVFIAYADIPSARSAIAHVATLVRTRASAEPWQPMLWRFDQLGAGGWSEMALQEAGRAAAVVIAFGANAPLTAAAETWLATLAARYRGKSVEMIALLDQEAWTLCLEETAPAAASAARTEGAGRDVMDSPDKQLRARAA
jgi:hypothetical protein